jgi:hypothetical protein
MRWSKALHKALKLTFVPAAPCRGIEVAGFVLNPLDEPCHLRMFTQRLRREVMPRQLGFCEQGMNLLVARSVQKHRGNTAPGFRNQVVCVSQSWWDRSIAKCADRHLDNLQRLSTRCRLQPFDTTLRHSLYFNIGGMSVKRMNQNHSRQNTRCLYFLKPACQHHSSGRTTAYGPTPSAQKPVGCVTGQRRGLIPMVLLIGLASNQKRQQTFGSTKRLEMVYLLLVMLINKSLYRGNRSINGASTKYRRYGTCQPAR